MLHPLYAAELELMVRRGVRGYRRRCGTEAGGTWAGYITGIDHVLRALGYRVEMVDGEPTGRVLRLS